MTRILVAEDEKRIRDLLVDILFDAGYDVIEAQDGGEAFEKASHETPDVILLDVMMPVMDGFQVLARIRANPATESIPVILLTALSPVHGEQTGAELGVDHYITKPFDHDMVQTVIKVVLREANVVDTPIRTRDILLDQALAGGIPLGSLTLIGGGSSAGKSVLCQHLAYGAVQEGHRVAYFTSENNTRSLITQMESIGLENAAGHLRADELRICPLDEPTPDGASDVIRNLLGGIENLPRQYKVIFLDSITNLAATGQESSIIPFFTSCKHLCNGGRTLILVAHSYAFDEQMFIRLASLCDAYLSLRVENSGAKLVKMLEVHKIHNAEQLTGNVVGFEVQPGAGIRIVPIRKAQV